MPAPLLPTELLTTLGDAWSRRIDQYPSWYAYGTPVKAEVPTLALFVAAEGPVDDFPALENTLQASGVRVELIRTSAFEAIPSRASKVMASKVQPGADVWATPSDNCPSEHGTVGAIVKNGADPSDPRRWVLGCNHVLARSPNCRTGLTIHFGNGSQSKSMDCVELSSNLDNLVDSAVSMLADPSSCDSSFPPGLWLKSGIPATASLGTPVRKFGQFTGLTTGLVAFLLERVAVSLPSTGLGDVSFAKQVLVQDSPGGDPFSGMGDSGALAVQGEQPIGVCFARATRRQEAVDNVTYAVLNHLDEVLAALAAKTGIQFAIDL